MAHIKKQDPEALFLPHEDHFPVQTILNPINAMNEINETDVKDEEDRIDETDGFNDSLAFSYFLW
jgi:hypothetical protein